MNRKNFILRQKIINLIREFFFIRGFYEVETPILVKAPDTSFYNEVFETELFTHSKKLKSYLTPSPEFFMKKLLVGGYKKIFQITKAFRNVWEEESVLHNPEFTILEWYRTESDYQDIMKDCEELIIFIFNKLKKKPTKNLKYQDKKIDLSSPWIKISVKKAFRQFAGINFDDFLKLNRARKIAAFKGYKIESKTSWEQIYHQIFLNEIENKLANFPKPVILYDYPAQLAALARLKKTDSRYAERFELYFAGLEIGNAFSELTDWREQKKRFISEINERKKRRMKIFKYDQDFLDYLKQGLPPSGGIAVGVDRLVMLFANEKRIQDVLFFPAQGIFSK